jgi:eukaryotic-like serine/threonine-protein kinase
MSELPPPERRPEPLGFDPAKNRIAEAREAAARSALPQPSPASLLPTRNIQQDLIGRTVSDRYLIRGVLGEGGMGTVYEAEHVGLGRQVAIKVLNPSQAKKRVAVKRFQQEARAAGAIGHPNICEVYDLGLLDDGSPYLVMEKLIGTTLADRISREGGLPFDEIADVMIQVLSGLIAAHDKGIVHRDIKPENIFLARRVGCPPIVKILDFGVSKMMPQFQGGSGEELDLTRTGMVMGTPYYMSPEQARGERNLDGRVDVYACGVMMYESIVGKRPFLAPNYNALLLSIINTTPKGLREVRPATPPAMEVIVGRMMAKARDDRYPTANAVMREIQALPVAAGSRVLPPPATAPIGRAPQDRGSRGLDPAEGPGATLRSRMADAAFPRSSGPRARGAQPPDSGDNSTRLDVKLVRQAAARRLPGSDSYDIPVHVVDSDRRPPQPATASADFVDEMPTEIFRPGMHVGPVPPKSASATRVHQAPPPRAPAANTAPPNLAPVNFAGLTGDEWDSETVVKKPAALTTTRHRDRPPSGHGRTQKPFNPDETVNLQGEIGIDVDFGDDTSASPPPRRR